MSRSSIKEALVLVLISLLRSLKAKPSMVCHWSMSRVKSCLSVFSPSPITTASILGQLVRMSWWNMVGCMPPTTVSAEGSTRLETSAMLSTISNCSENRQVMPT